MPGRSNPPEVRTEKKKCREEIRRILDLDIAYEKEHGKSKIAISKTLKEAGIKNANYYAFLNGYDSAVNVTKLRKVLESFKTQWEEPEDGE